MTLFPFALFHGIGDTMCEREKKKKGKQRRIDKGFLRVSFKRKLRYSKYKLGSFFWVEYPFSSNYQNKYPF